MFRKKLRLIALLILTLGINFRAYTQLITVNSSIDRDSIMIGEQVNFNLTVLKDDSLNVLFPLLQDTITGDIEIISDEGIDTTEENGKTKLVRLMKITSFNEGLQIIPPQPVAFRGEGITDTVFSSPVYLHVYSPAIDTTQAIKPIKPPVNTPLNFAEIMPWMLWGFLGMLGLSLIIAVIWLLLHKEKLAKIFTSVKEEAAHVVAFRDLDKLKEEKLPEHGKTKEFYSRLTEIIRRYIEKQYGIPAMEITTIETLELFSKSNPDDQLLDEMLEQLLQLGDLVKFAKQDPSPLENQTNLNNAYLFVQKTYPFFITPVVEENNENNDVESEETVKGDE